MNWIYKKEGLINHYNSEMHQGSQPIRVLNPMIIFMFQNTYSKFIFELKEQVEKKIINNELDLIFKEESVISDQFNTPKITKVDRKIHLHESFLSYLWCITYSIYVLYLETIDYNRVNKENRKITHPINDDNIKKANELFYYGKSLISLYSLWDKEQLPNPEKYLAEKRDYIEQTNCFFTDAVKFILCHEYTHAKLHLDKFSIDLDISYYLDFEQEADKNAIDMLLKGDIGINRHSLEIGIVCGILSIFYFSSSTKSSKYPNTEDRLTNALIKLDLEDDSHVWGIACVGLKLWNDQFNLNMDWGKETKSYKDLYFDIIKQIKEKE